MTGPKDDSARPPAIPPETSGATDPDLVRVADVTLGYYERTAEDFRAGTMGHDVSQNYAALLGAIEGAAPFSILDLGCGPGRDLKYFRSLGHEAIGLDGSAAFVAMARDHSGCEVWQRDFMDMRLPDGRFDGVFANASLFHVPSRALPKVLGDLARTLKPRGVLFCSNPRGDNREGFSGERYGHFCDLETWRGYVAAAGFEEVRHYFRPEGQPRERQPWLATVWRRR